MPGEESEGEILLMEERRGATSGRGRPERNTPCPCPCPAALRSEEGEKKFTRERRGEERRGERRAKQNNTHGRLQDRSDKIVLILV